MRLEKKRTIAIIPGPEPTDTNRDTPDFDALEALLKTRYGYWDDDIEHRSYFIHFQAG